MRGVKDDYLPELLERAKKALPKLEIEFERCTWIKNKRHYRVCWNMRDDPEREFGSMMSRPCRRVEALSFLEGMVTGAEEATSSVQNCLSYLVPWLRSMQAPSPQGEEAPR